MRVFLSHAWADQSPARVAENPRRGLVRKLRDSLAAAGTDVFFDEEQIADLDDIEARIREGFATCTVFVCWYSDAYRKRRACHWELLAGITSDRSRVIAVNPEPNLDHVLPSSLRNRLIPAPPAGDDEAGWQALAESIVRFAAERGGTFNPPPAETTQWYGDPPARFSRLVARADELWEIDSLLRPQHALSGGGPVPSAVVVHGLGGVGKTALAFEYAASFAGSYPDGVFWLRAQADEGSAELIETQLENRRASEFLLIAEQLEPPPAGKDSLRAARSLREAERIIEHRLSGGEFLWVIDDLPAGLSPDVFRRWLPLSSVQGRVLVTTRGTTYRHVPNVALDVLELDEAVTLLESAGADVADRPTAEALASQLGHLPLALEVVGALASLPGISPATLLAELRDPLGLVEEAAASPLASASGTEHPLSIAATFSPSLRRLDKDSLVALTVAAALSVGPLPASVIQRVVERIGDMSSRAFTRALGTLLSRSLVRRIDGEAFEVHPLMAAATLQWQSASENYRESCVEAAAGEVVSALGDVDDISSHANQWRTAAFGQALALSPHHTSDGEDKLALLRTLGRYMHVERRMDEAVVLERLAAAMAAERSAQDPRGALTAQLNLGLSLQHAGDPSSDDVVRDALQQLEARFGPDDLDVLTAKHNLSAWSRTNEAETRELAVQVFNTRRRLLGMDHPHTLFSLHSLLSHDDLPDIYPDFVSAYEDLIERRTRVVGADHGTTLTSISNFVERLVRIGRPRPALPLARRLVDRRSALYGADHAATLAAKERLFLVLAALPEPPWAEIETLADELERGLAALVHGSQFRVAAQALSNAALVLLQSGRASLSVVILERALPVVADRLGPTDRTTYLLEHNLAAAVAAVGNLDQASRRFDRLLERIQESLDGDDRLVLRARRQQSIVKARLGEHAGALQQQLWLVEVWEARAGPTSAELAEALGDVAETFDLAGDTSRAAQFRRRQKDVAAATQSRSPNWV